MYTAVDVLLYAPHGKRTVSPYVWQCIVHSIVVMTDVKFGMSAVLRAICND